MRATISLSLGLTDATLAHSSRAVWKSPFNYKRLIVIFSDWQGTNRALLFPDQGQE